MTKKTPADAKTPPGFARLTDNEKILLSKLASINNTSSFWLLYKLTLPSLHIDAATIIKTARKFVSMGLVDNSEKGGWEISAKGKEIAREMGDNGNEQ